MTIPEQQHWSSQREVTSSWGVRLLLNVYRYGGRPTFLVLVCPVVFYYFLFARTARRASLDYLQCISKSTTGQLIKSNWWWSYRHFLSFALSLLDKFTAGLGGANEQTVQFPERGLFAELSQQKRGAVLLTTHLGNTEMCRALSSVCGGVRLNILVHTRHAKKFNKLLAKINGGHRIELIQVSKLTPATAVMLSERVQNGELVVVSADRTPIEGSSRKVTVNFLGEKAMFPQGPFILAALLKCPVYSLFCLRERRRHKVYIELFGEQLKLPRNGREQMLEIYAQQFADQLAHYCQLAPLQWYNFYDFWRKD